MKKIAVLSDTHGFFHPRIPEIFSQCHEIWHCGDFGSIEIADRLSSIAFLRGVYGNIDGQNIRADFPVQLVFECEDVKVLLTHIGGYPGRYDKRVSAEIKTIKPDLFVCGHSHILKVMNDKKNNLLHINPGAAGKYGFHHVITFIRFIIDGKNIRDMEVIELPKQDKLK